MKSMELAEHATKVMANLDEMINGLDDMDYFFHHLHNLGKFHRKIPGFQKENFLVSLPIFIDFFFFFFIQCVIQWNQKNLLCSVFNVFNFQYSINSISQQQ